MSESFPKDKINVLLVEGIHERAVECFSQAGYTKVTRIKQALSRDELIDALDGVHMLGIRSRTHLDAEIFAQANKLMAVGCFCIGTNQVHLDAARGAGVPVFNAPHSNTRSVAEMVMGYLIMLFRGLGDKNTAAHEGRWLKTASGSFELRGKTLGIVGYGHIGSQVSILAEAFGMRVLYHDIEPQLPMGNAQQVESLAALLEQSDAVTLHVPETPETRNMIGARELQSMRPGSALLNASRGTVVEVQALADAVRDGHLMGAALDVFPKEPASLQERFESPLQGLNNVVLTPHVGGSTQEAQVNIGAEVARKLVQYSDQGSTIGAVEFPNISLTPHKDAHRLLHVHRNQPGVLGAINAVLGGADANIVGQYLQTTRDVGYVVTDVDTNHDPALLDKLRSVDGTIRARILY